MLYLLVTTRFDSPSLILRPGFHCMVSLNSQEIKKLILMKPICVWNAQFDEENWKKDTIIPKKLMFGQTYMKFDGLMVDWWPCQKWWTHHWHIIREWINSYTERFSPLRLNLLFKPLIKPKGLYVRRSTSCKVISLISKIWPSLQSVLSCHHFLWATATTFRLLPGLNFFHFSFASVMPSSGW